MPVSASGKRLGRRGVSAIFTPDREQRDARFVVGLACILAGIALWTTVILDSAYPKLFGASEISSFLSMVLTSVGMIFAISGAGICIRYSIFKPVYRNSRITETVDPSTNAIVTEPESTLQDFEGSSVGTLSSKNVKLGLIAFLQSCLGSVLYSGLVDEYHSNNVMQHWLSSIFPYGQQVLSWEAVLFASALFGIIVVQFLPGRALVE